MTNTIHLPEIDATYDRDLAIRAAKLHLLCVKTLHGQPELTENYWDLAVHSFASLLGDDEELQLAAELIEAAIERDRGQNS